ncbi:AraC family transcriptional regulator [Colwellia sp. UCD-KL20]|uniref:AraC family transcriptional regulator n=1 Tax=Colwellia sp. UCD-KL20 TaxID=1917165 RepID=UPI0009709D29|nr:AraC family transcriptional regulator [Colwellia sp. UCD-KL20]
MNHISRISIRSYTNNIQSHAHSYHQLVLPLHGSINISVGEFSGLVSMGDCVIIRSGETHQFKAHENARFIVVDTHTLPENITASPNEKVSINAPLLAFIQFIETQLNHHINQEIEAFTFQFFYQLLALQPLSNNIDKRLNKVLSYISQHLTTEITNTQLAQLAFLSTTQFKKVFKDNIGLTTQQYIIQQRMEKAKTLLTHTDTPIAIIAEQVGYQSPSAFSRKFKAYFGNSPKAFSRWK